MRQVAAFIQVVFVALLGACASAPPTRPPVSMGGLQERHIDSPSGDVLRFCLVAPTTFTMGDNENYERDETLGELLTAGKSPVNEGPEHQVTITRPFWIAEYETTTADFCVFLNEADGSDRFVRTNEFACVRRGADGRWAPTIGSQWVYDRTTRKQKLIPLDAKEADAARLAVNTATWEGAAAYAAWLSKRSGVELRLPTEAEWELAARGEAGRRHPWGNKVPRDTSVGKVTRWGEPVGTGTIDVTPEGVRDMQGSVSEWVSDWYAREYPSHAVTDPVGPDIGKARVLRGRRGLTSRTPISPAVYDQIGMLGFRLVLVNRSAESAIPTNSAK